MNARGPFQIAVVDHAVASAELRAVRDVVFVQEQGVPREIEIDDLDPRCRHVLARDAGGAAIGTARLTPEGRIGRMAVLREWRAAGVGSALLQGLLRQAREDGLEGVSLHAQATAVGFYERHGFAPVGERFLEAGIEHLSMQLRLDQPRPVEGRDAAVAITTTVVQAARRQLWIYSRELDPGLYDHPRVVEALRAFGTAGVGGEARILLHDATAAQRGRAPLIALAQRLPSVFLFREVEDPVDRHEATAFIANDAGDYYFRPLGHRYDGEAELCARGRARQLRSRFDETWERARPCAELRAIGL